MLETAKQFRGRGAVVTVSYDLMIPGVMDRNFKLHLDKSEGMNMIKGPTLFITLSVALLGTGWILAKQGSPAVGKAHEAIKNTIAQNEKDWRFKESSIISDKIFQIWQHKSEKIESRVSVYWMTTAELASQDLSRMMGALETLQPPRRIEGIGDEAYFYASADVPGMWIAFRKGSMIGRVETHGAGGDLSEITKRFAGHILDSVEKK